MARIIVRSIDGKSWRLLTFDSNQEAVDAMVKYHGMPVNIDFQANGARPWGISKKDEMPCEKG